MAISNKIIEDDVFDSESLENETEFKTLVRSIKLSKGFSLFFARANEISTQAELIANLENEFPKEKIVVIHFRNQTNHFLDALRKILANQKPFAVLVYGLNDSFPTTPDSPKNSFIKNLNASRNSFQKTFDCPIVLFVPDFAITAIMRGANDFFSVRSNVFYFEDRENKKESQIGQIISEGLTEIGSLTIEERKERIKTIHDLLKEEKDKERQVRLHLSLGQLYYFSAEYKKAEFEYNLALKLSKKLNDLEIKAHIYNNLANVYREQGRYAEAIEKYEEALKIGEKTIGKEGLNYAVRLSNLANVYREQGRYAEAIEKIEEALKIGEKTIGKEHPNYATRLNNLAAVYDSQGRYSEAIEKLEEVLKIDEKTISKKHPEYAIHLGNLAVVYEAQGKYQEALDLFEEALRINEKTLPKNHPYTIQGRESVARCRAMLGK